MNGPTPFDYIVAIICFSFAGVVLLALALGWLDDWRDRRRQR